MENAKKADINPPQYLEGFALTGEYVNNLADKHFQIVLPPFYKEMDDLKRQGQKIRKLVLTVKLATGEQMEYIPNKTAQKTVANIVGSNLNNWVGFKGEFKTMEQSFSGMTKQVIYIKEKK